MLKGIYGFQDYYIFIYMFNKVSQIMNKNSSTEEMTENEKLLIIVAWSVLK